MTLSVATRFWSKVDKSGDCWLWTASLSPSGYAQIRIGGKDSLRVYSHRWAYEQEKGPIPEGMELDHLCRVRHCVNPAHLEPVTHAENHSRRTGHRSGPYDVGDYCRNGHLRADHGAVNKNGYRICRMCNRDAVRKSRIKRQL